ncbi:MAG: hypothetical protein WKF89_17620 [Chitinophagaceae bacterium]
MNRKFRVDDDVGDQFRFREVIESINISPHCDTATNRNIALDKLKASTSLADIILIGLNMPVINGFDFLIQFRKDDALSNIKDGILTTSNILR